MFRASGKTKPSICNNKTNLLENGTKGNVRADVRNSSYQEDGVSVKG